MYVVIIILSLIVALSISSTLNMWDLTYSVLLTALFVALSWVMRFTNDKKLSSLAIDRNHNRKKMKAISIALSCFSGLLFVTPAILLISLVASGINIFNPYMLLALYIVFIIGFYVCIGLEANRMDKANKTQEKDKSCLTNENEAL